MQPPLKNAAGYRSPYINALNAAATANEVVAGDLAIHRTPQGTTLRIPPRPRLRRFRLALGYLASTPVALLSEGNLILASGRAALLPGKDVAWSDATGPNPGWYSTALPAAQDQWLDVILAQHIPTGAVYVVFQSGAGDEPAAPLHQLLPADLGTLAETDVTPIVTIGRFFIPASTSSSSSNAIQIAQYIADDIPALGLSTPTPFNHRFKVTAEPVTDDNGNTSITLHVRPGSVWKRDGDALATIGLAPVSPLVADGDGWTVPNAISGSVYIIQVGDAYQIKHSNPEGDTGAVLLRIADVTVTTSDPPTATIVQRQIGDFVLADPAGEETPVAWRVALRKKEVSSGTIDQWQIFAPTWTVGRETLLPEGMVEDWNDLDVTSGTLYAVLTWTGTATTDDAGEVKTTWTPGKPVITNDLSKIPADDDPTPDDPSTSTIEGKEGHRSIIVKIGTFLTDDAGSEEEPSDPIGFLQLHTGSIIEDLNAGSTAPASEDPIDNPVSFEVRKVDETQSDGTVKKVWKIWTPAITFAFNDDHNSDIRYWKRDVGARYGWKPLDSQPSGFNRSLWAWVSWKGTISGTSTPKIIKWENDQFGISSTAEIPPSEKPSRYSGGRVTVAWQIGLWRDEDTWVQMHVGWALIPWPRETPYAEEEEIPISLAITDDGKLEVTTRRVSLPMADSDFDEKTLLNLPSGGGASDVLGPIEWDASRNAYVQHLGKWTWTGSAWTFAKKMNGNTAYPPAAIYPVTAAQLLVRANRYGTPDAAGDNIAVIPFNLPFASAAASTWLSKRESTVSNGVVYTPPDSADGEGSLDSKTFTLTYWSDTGETNAQTANLLDSIVEGANESSTYEG